jgi:ABC-type phosphate/phosphonate transport system substrate-binding protein
MTSPKLLPAIALLLCLAPCAARADEIKVGITEYQGVEAAYKKYQQLFRELERQACEMRNVKREDCEARKSITFKFAIGTYGEVIDWYNKGLVDVAVLSALPMTDLLNSTSEAEHGRIADAFVGRVGPRPRGTSPLRCDDGERLRRLNDAGPPPAAGADQSFQYHVSAVVLKSSGVTSFDEIRERAKKKQVKFLFVRPFSVSGYVLPSNFLKERGVSWSEDDYEYTYQHHETLRRMLSPTSEEAREDAGRLLVGFAIEDTPYCAKDERQQYFTKLPAEGLEKNIPHEVVLANYNLLNTAPQRYAQVKRDLLALFTRAESIFRRASPGGKPSTDSLELEIKSRKSVEAAPPGRSGSTTTTSSSRYWAKPISRAPCATARPSTS